MIKDKSVILTLKKSPIGRKPQHKQTLTGLGLRRINQNVTLKLDPCIQGMINKISYLISVEYC